MPFFLGPFGGVRATVALRPFLSELGMVILPSTVSIPTIQNSNITEEGGTEENERYLNQSQTFWVWHREMLDIKELGKHGFVTFYLIKSNFVRRPKKLEDIPPVTLTFNIK